MIKIYPLSWALMGPFSIQGYGIALVCGLIVSLSLMFWHLKAVTGMSFDTFSSIICQATLVGLLGGRLMHVITEWRSFISLVDVLAIWQGGLSILGALIAVALFIGYALKKKALPFFPALDIAALYIPLAHAGGRLGCLWAGCCFGMPTSVPWAVAYQSTTVGAPVGVPLHPTQLYSALCFILLFCIMYAAYKNGALRIPGLLIGIYFVGACTERFILDFVRDDRLMSGFVLSFHQWLALIACSGALLVVHVVKKKHEHVSDER